MKNILKTLGWKKVERIPAKGDTYKKHRKSKCECCDCTDDLTVHHVFPQDAINHFDVETIDVTLLSTLCDTCHKNYEREASDVKNKLKQTVPLRRGFDKAVCALNQLKNKKTRAKLSAATVKANLDYLNVFTRKYITLCNLPESLDEYKASIYDGYELKDVKSLWRKHFRYWLFQEQMMFTKTK